MLKNHVHYHVHVPLLASIDNCREVWPDDVFGKSGMPMDQEMDAVRDLFVHHATGKHFGRTGDEGYICLDWG